MARERTRVLVGDHGLAPSLRASPRRRVFPGRKHIARRLASQCRRNGGNRLIGSLSGCPGEGQSGAGPSGAFSSEVETGSRQENASKQESRAPFRFHRNGKGLARAIPVAQLGERRRDELVQFLVGLVLPRLRGAKGLEIRSRRIVLKQHVSGQASAGRSSHVIPRNTRYKFSGAGEADLVFRSRRKFAGNKSAPVF